jgi:hypothetical protein
MSPKWWQRWLKRKSRSSSTGCDRKQSGSKRPFRPRVEVLEERTMLSTVKWINPASGDWDTASN